MYSCIPFLYFCFSLHFFYLLFKMFTMFAILGQLWTKSNQLWLCICLQCQRLKTSQGCETYKYDKTTFLSYLTCKFSDGIQLIWVVLVLALAITIALMASPHAMSHSFPLKLYLKCFHKRNGGEDRCIASNCLTLFLLFIVFLFFHESIHRLSAQFTQYNDII